MAKIVRFDFGTPVSFKRDDNGFLQAQATLTRTGVFYYVNADGSVRAELRVEDEVFNPETLASMKMLPVTNEHPPEMLNPQNAKQWAVGFGGEQIEREGQMVKTSLKVTDAATIADIEDGSKQEISMGYMAELDFSPGVFEGVRYDAIQRNIRYNHIAVVPKGRAGSQCRIRTDSDDVRSSIDHQPPNDGGSGMKRVVHVDGFKIELPENEAQAIQSRLDADSGKMKEMEDQVSKLKDEYEAAKKKLEEMKGKEDALEGKLQEAVAELEKVKKDSFDLEKINALVKARGELVAKAKPFVSEETKLDGLSDLEIKVAAIKGRFPEKSLEGFSDERIDGLFEGICESVPPSGATKLDAALSGLQSRDEELESIRKDAWNRECDRWKDTLKPAGK